jgi:hypothetical protein
MSVTEQRRTLVLTRVGGGDLSPGDAASLGCSERQLWRLLRRFRSMGPAGLVHGNRGRRSERRIGDAIQPRVVALAKGRYAGANDTHLSEVTVKTPAQPASRSKRSGSLRRV